MKLKNKVASVALITLVCVPAMAAQKTPAEIKTDSASRYTTNGVKAITGAILNSTMQDIADSFGGLLSTNTWGSAQTFSVMPIFSAASNCYLKANGASAINCVSTIPASAISGSFGAINATGAASVGGALTVVGDVTLGKETSIGPSAFASRAPGRFAITGNTTSGSPSITGIASTAGIQVGLELTGAGIPACITSHGVARNQVKTIGANSITMTCAATATASGVTINVGRDMYDANSAILATSLGAKVGYFGDASAGQGASWLNAYFSGFVGSNPQTSTPLVVTGINGGVGGPLFASRATDAAGSANFGDHFALRTFAVADGMTKVGTPSHTWSHYGVTIAKAAGDGDTAQASVNEFEIVSEWTPTDINPYTTNYSHTTTNTSLGCGGGGSGAAPAQACSAALYIFQNNAAQNPFLEGIVFRDGSISTTLDGAIGYAVHMSRNQALHWSSASGVDAGSIWSDTNGDLQLKAKDGRTVRSGSPLELASSTVASLPTCDTPRKFSMMAVTDANSTTYNSIAAGGGANVMPVFCDGANWRLH